MFDKMIKCKTCGAEIAKNANPCPHCGANRWNGASKLTTCKTCGSAISKNANKCPNCGARQHQIVFAVCTAIAVVCIVLCAIAIGLGISVAHDKKQADPTMASAGASAPTPAIAVSARDLWQAYSSNKVNADNLYQDKLVAVSGTIIDIGQDLVTKAPCVSLDTGDAIGLYAIQCFFSKNGEQNGIIASLSDGDSITIFGTCEGTPVLQVQLTGCYFSQ